MHPSTELASTLTVARYEQLRAHLTSSPPDEGAWHEVIEAMHQRIKERFLDPIKELARFDEQKVLPFRPGFSIIALDCLLIDTIQSFREGRVGTGERSPAHSFKKFLQGKPFKHDFRSAKDREDFFGHVRNAILHKGETRNNWKIRIDTKGMLERDEETKTRTINRRLFHAAVEQEFEALIANLKEGNEEARQAFLRRVDALAGHEVEAPSSYYFAYGSNLKDEECRNTAEEVKGYGVAFLPGFRLAGSGSQPGDGQMAGSNGRSCRHAVRCGGPRRGLVQGAPRRGRTVTRL